MFNCINSDLRLILPKLTKLTITPVNGNYFLQL